jgi:hypothetical protein
MIKSDCNIFQTNDLRQHMFPNMDCVYILVHWQIPFIHVLRNMCLLHAERDFWKIKFNVLIIISYNINTL